MIHILIDIIIAVITSVIIVTVLLHFDNEKYAKFTIKTEKAPVRNLEYVFLFSCVSIIGVEYNSVHGDAIHYMRNEKQGEIVTVFKGDVSDTDEYVQLKWSNLDGVSPYFVEQEYYNKIKRKGDKG